MPRKNRANRRSSSSVARAAPVDARRDVDGVNSTRNGRRSIVRAAILRECFDAVDDARRGTIVVEDFLERLRSDSEMTDRLQAGTEASREELDAVFDGLERASERTVDADEFMELFVIGGEEDLDAFVEMGADGVSKAEVEVKGAGARTAAAESSRAESPVVASARAPKEVPTAERGVEPVTAGAPAPASPMPGASASAVVDTVYLRQVFDLIDYDNNGEVTLVEFLSALHSNPEIGALLDEGTSAAGDDVSQIVSDVFSRMDADQNKSVNFQEFVKYFTVQQSNAQHAMNKLSAEEKKRLIESADKARVRSMSALKRGIRLVSKGALKAGLRKSKSDLKEENLSKMADEDLLVMKSYLRDVYKLVDYEKNERIVLQEFLTELAENRNIAISLDVGSNAAKGGVEKTKKMIAIVFRVMEIDAKVVVTFPEFVNYFIKISSEKFNGHSPLARSSTASINRSAQANAQIQSLVAELFQLERISPPKEPEPVAEQKKPAPRAPAEPVDELVYGDEENEELDREVHVLRKEIQTLMAENQRQKMMNNLLKLKMNALTHMYAVQSVEFQALIDSTREQ